MGIEYLDKTHARLVVSRGTGANRIRKVKRITYTSKKDAKRQYDAFVRSVNFDADGKMTVGELVSWYIGIFEDNGGKATTVRGYRTAEKAIAEYFDRKRAIDVSLRDVETYIRKQGKTLSPKTIKNRISLLSSAYTAAIRRGFLDKNPCEYAVIPKQRKPEIEILSDKDVDRFVAALDDMTLDFKVMCELALFCGLRRSELYGLHKDDVTDTVTVNKVRHRINGEDIIQTPKTKSSIRTLAVPRFIQDDVARLKSEQESRPVQNDFLILNELGEPVHHSWASKNLNRLIAAHDLPHVTLHGLRHTCASMLISAGIPITEVSAQLGHASIDITLRSYAHLFQDASTASKRISDLMDDRMTPKRHQGK